MQNAELWNGQRPIYFIHKVIFEENTFILHSAFRILHFERQLGKLQFTVPLGMEKGHVPETCPWDSFWTTGHKP